MTTSRSIGLQIELPQIPKLPFQGNLYMLYTMISNDAITLIADKSMCNYFDLYSSFECVDYSLTIHVVQIYLHLMTKCKNFFMLRLRLTPSLIIK